MSKRIEEAFANGKAFIPFITSGDPSLDVTEQLVYAMEEAGADLIEIGIPFSALHCARISTDSRSSSFVLILLLLELLILCFLQAQNLSMELCYNYLLLNFLFSFFF